MPDYIKATEKDEERMIAKEVSLSEAVNRIYQAVTGEISCGN